MALHQTTRFGLARQNVRGTAAAGITPPYIRGRVQQHGLNLRYEMIDTSGEHTGVHSRSTALQSTPIRAGSIIDVSFRHRLYPSMVGLELLGLGFTVSTSTVVILTISATGGTFTVSVISGTTQTTAATAFNATAATLQTNLAALSNVSSAIVTGSAGGPYTITILTTATNSIGLTASTLTANAAGLTGGSSTAVFSGFYYTHVFTLPSADSEGWLTAYDFIGETGGFDRIVRDVRLSQLTFTADNTGIVVAGTGLGLVLANAAGTETFTAEIDAVLSQANGAFTLSATDFTPATIGTPRSHTISFDNPLAEDEQELHTMNRATLSPTGKTITGTIAGLDFSENAWKEWYWGSASGTAVTIPYPASTGFTWNFASAGNISTAAAVPYRMTFSIPVAQWDMQPFDLTAGGNVLYDCAYRVTDALSAAPITVTLVNAIPSYAGT
ncbi:MAG: hypothetical protein DDT21_01841 [Syntrophomonadaceae bacterium]|nr:hypothetical protein [Bacillota bacterium]